MHLCLYSETALLIYRADCFKRWW